VAQVEIGIPTKNRPRVLGRCLAALLAQTFQDWDLTIINDSPDVPFDPITEHWLDCIRRNHRVRVIEAGGWGQVKAHNWVLYNSEAPFILRLDDDVLLNAYALQGMMHHFYLSPDIGAVGGLWFPTFAGRSVVEGWEPEWANEGHTIPSWGAQITYPSEGTCFRVQHLYSCCLYRAEAMRAVGGWPEVYSVGVARGEETEGTYKLHLAGYGLLVEPRATGQHLFAAGGIRSDPVWQERYDTDYFLWLARKPQLDALDFERPIRVLVYSNHGEVIGGAERLFLHTVHLLQQVDGLDVYPLFLKPDVAILTPDKCESAFGFRYDDRAGEEWPDRFDVGICASHEGPLPPYPCDHLINYCLFPIATEAVSPFEVVLAISKFTAEHIKARWHREAEVLYPPVPRPQESDVQRPIPCAGSPPVSLPPYMGREKLILFVGRFDPAKAPIVAIHAFRQSGLAEQGWRLLLVGDRTPGHEAYAEFVETVAETLPNVAWTRDLTDVELAEFYQRATILIAPRGIYEQRPDFWEHYGYTVVEAQAHGCIPLACDKGGHRETVPDHFRWSTEEHLIRLLQELCTEQHSSQAQDLLTFRPDPAEYVERLTQIIRQVVYLARDERPLPVRSLHRPLRVLLVSDHPDLPTGWGIAARMVGQGIQASGHAVVQLGSGGVPAHNPYFQTTVPWSVWKGTTQDPDGGACLRELLLVERPDIALIIRDIGGVGGYLQALRAAGFTGPVVGYFPLEGLPLWRGHAHIIAELDGAATWLPFAAREIKRVVGRDVLALPPGADHAPFAPLPPFERERLRGVTGFTGFVVGQVATNRRVKAPWRLLYALALLRKAGQAQGLQCYLHMQAENGGMWEGFDLIDEVARLGIADLVRFAPDLQPETITLLAPLAPMMRANPRQWVAYDRSREVLIPTVATEYIREALPQLQEDVALDLVTQMMQLVSLSMVERYNLLDLLVLPHEVEGAGLPVLEAMACGVPVAVTNDVGRAMSTLAGEAAILMEAKECDKRGTGVDLHLVNPATIAGVIQQVRDDEELRRSLSELGRAHAAKWRWGPTTARLADLVGETWYTWQSKTPPDPAQ